MDVYRETSLAAVRPLLTAAGLPTTDLAEDLEHFFACGRPGDPDGVVGLEILGRDAILRSLAVSAKARGHGCGNALVAAAERYAQAHDVRRVYPLTETAPEFFERLGYRHADRSATPDAIRRSREFAEW